MAAKQSNLRMVQHAAKGLGDLCDRVAFLGGATTGLLVTDPAAAEVRTTLDVDVIVEVASRQDYYALEEDLRQHGFKNDTREGAPLCRWRLDDLILDVMPTDSAILGFSNRWYAEALHHAQRTEVAKGVTIRLVTAPYFLATKFEAFHGRGKDDYLASHDLEDIVSVLDGRVELVEEIQAADPGLRRFIAKEVSALLRTPQFLDAMPGHLPPDAANQRRASLVVERLKAIAGLGRA